MPARRSSAHRTLHLLMANLGETDSTLGAKIGISRQSMHAKRTGRTAMTADDIELIARVIGTEGVDPTILMGPPHEAVAWLVRHRAHELDDVLSSNPAEFRCTAPKLNRPLYGAKLLVRRSPSGLRPAA